VVVVVSGIWQTTCVAVRSGDEGFLIDSPVLPDELDALPGVLEQAGFPVSGLLCTHGDWDHMLGRLAFPDASLGVGEATAERLRSSPGAVQRELRSFDEEHYVERPRPLQLAGGIQELPVPGRLSIGAGAEDREIELHPAAGHTADGVAFWVGWARVLVCGDYLSPVEIPMVSAQVDRPARADADGHPRAYADTLARLAPLVQRAETVVPGHGGPLAREDALRILEEDAAYMAALVGRGAPAAGDLPLPAGRRTPAQRAIHARNLAVSARLAEQP
jgi:glyoxylase-like metal-dependent hydrolase (beta-lactamase superfamily II)